MDDKNKVLLTSIVIGFAVVIAALLYVGKAQVLVNVAPPSVSVAPGAVNVTPGAVNVTNPGTGQTQTFGSAAGDTTNWTAGSFSSDLGVGGTATVNNFTSTGTLTLSGSVSNSGTSTFTGTAIGFPRLLTTSMTNGTNTVCSVQNTSGQTRVVWNAFAKVSLNATNAASIGVFAAGTSTGPTVTSTSPWISTQITRSSTLDVLTPTSTFASSTAGSVTSNIQTWRNLEWVNFNQGATTVAAGTCYVEYTQ